MPGSELDTARRLTAQAAAALRHAPAYQALPAQERQALAGDLEAIHAALHEPVPLAADPYAFALETPADRLRGGFGRTEDAQSPPPAPAPPPAPRPAAATETLAPRLGALTDEVDFATFVATLVHGTFDAIVDASIRQMEAFASLVSAVAKDVDRFTADNVSLNQVRDHLVTDHPGDLVRVVPTPDAPEPKLAVRPVGDGGEARSPAWLGDYGLAGEELTDELAEEQLVPAARRAIGEDRMKTLATLVLLGMNRVNVRDGRISARVRFRAAAHDHADVSYAASQDPGGISQGWGARGSSAFSQASTMVSTVGVNAQTDTQINAELFGEVEINFVSETLPLDRFVDASKMALLQRNAHAPVVVAAPAPALVAPAVPAPVVVAAPAPALVAPAVPAPTPAPPPAATP